MFCAKVEPIVHELEREFGDRIACKIAKHNEGDSQERIKRYGLEVHGMVINDASDAVLWSESGHKQTKAGATAAIRKVLGE